MPNGKKPSSSMSRRTFMKSAAAFAAAFGLPSGAVTAIAGGLERLAAGNTRVIWLQGQSCSGCSVSFLNSDSPDALEVVTEMISLVYHQTISAAQGDLVMDIIEKARDKTKYVLVMEGSIPEAMPEACTMSGKPLAAILPGLIRNASCVMAIGSCATYGGIPAAEGNPTGAVSMMEFMKKRGIETKGKLVNCPSCPVHPQSIVGTIAYVAGRGYPPVHPRLLTPNMFYSASTHDHCPRYHYYDRRIFSKDFGDPEGCLFKLGCLGMLSFTECPRRQWNGGINWCIRAAAPCIGCSHEHFAKRKSFPFYRMGESDGESKERNKLLER